MTHPNIPTEFPVYLTYKGTIWQIAYAEAFDRLIHDITLDDNLTTTQVLDSIALYSTYEDAEKAQ